MKVQVLLNLNSQKLVEDHLRHFLIQSQQLQAVLLHKIFRLMKLLVLRVYYKNIKNFETKLGIKLNPKSKKIVGTFSALVPHKDPVTLVKTIKELKKMRKRF